MVGKYLGIYQTSTDIYLLSLIFTETLKWVALFNHSSINGGKGEGEEDEQSADLQLILFSPETHV